MKNKIRISGEESETIKKEIFISLVNVIIAVGLIALLVIISVNLAYAETPAFTNVCCEKTTYGAWCQNNNPDNCNSAFRKTPTSCDATSYCRAGCCYNSQEGICMENTPQLVCQMNNGTWADSAECKIPQCNLGCCLVGDQAAFTTLVRCKKIAGFYGTAVNFKTDVNSESECIALTQAPDKGACVFDLDFERTCKFTTRGDCEAMKGKGNATVGNITFYNDYLCSAEELGTNCAPTEKTICIEGRDEVYFQDSCGNAADIYDSGKINDKAYWKKIIQKKDSCGFNKQGGNANSQGCGNCDYFSGSYCRVFDKSKDKKPTYGDNVCRDLNCYKTSDGNNYRHGESWCVYDAPTGNGKDVAGSRGWKHVCIAGEELVEPCDDFRQEICIQDKISTDKGDFQQAGCAANKWQDCVAQRTQKDCENQDKRDCMWINDVIGSAILGSRISQTTTTQKAGTYQTNTFGSTTSTTGKVVATGNAGLLGGDDSSSSTPEVVTLKGGVCVPNYPPGLKFWTDEASGICSLGNAQCEVEMEKKGLLGGSEKAVKNGECLDASWEAKNEQICQALGDCEGSDGEGKPGVYKYLQSGGFGITGTGLGSFLLPFVKAGNYISGLAIFNQSESINKGLVESMKK